MSDRFPASLSIGGPVPRKIIPLLCQAIADQGVGLDWEEGFEPKTEADLLDAADGGVLTVTDAEANYGEMPELEGFCRAHDIAFDRRSDARYEYDGECVLFRPGTAGESDHWFHASQDGNPLVPAEEVQKIKEALKARQFKRALRLAEKLVPDVPELPPLSFVNDDVPLDEDDEELLREMAEDAAEVRPDATA
jgi:hypothetical protein